ALGVEAAANLVDVGARDEERRRRQPGHRVVEVAAVLPAEMERVAEPLVGDEGNAAAAPGKQRVDAARGSDADGRETGDFEADLAREMLDGHDNGAVGR